MKAKCPDCGKLLNIPDRLLGKIVKCPCGRQLRVRNKVAKSAAPISAGSSSGPEQRADKTLPTAPPTSYPAKTPPPIPSSADDPFTLSDLTSNYQGSQAATVASYHAAASADHCGDTSQQKESVHLDQLINAENEIQAKKLTDASEQSRKQFVITLTAIFFAIVIPLGTYLVIKTGVATTAFYQDWEDKIMQDSLQVRAQQSGGVNGPQSQSIFDLKQNREYRNPEMLKRLASRYEARVNDILASINEGVSSKGELEQSFVDSMTGYPKEMTVKSIKCEATSNDRIKIKLVAHGEPLNYDFEASYYATNIDKPSWVRSEDNWNQGSNNNAALRKQIRDELDSKMQSVKSNSANNQSGSRSGSSNNSTASSSKPTPETKSQVPRYSEPQRSSPAYTWRPKVLNVEIGAGDVTITDRGDNGLSNVKIVCNNGLIIDADWERNVFNDFGYDIYEPTVSMTYNKLAVMTTARGVIANYLNGEYD